MISLPDREAMLAALHLPLPADLHATLSEIVDHAAETDVLDLTYVVVVEPADTEDAIAKEIGFSPLADPIDGIRWDRPNFDPYWAYLGRRGDSWMLVHPVGNDGFAFILHIDAAAHSELTGMCERFATVTP